MSVTDKQAVGSNFVFAKMLEARDRTWEVLNSVARYIEPGMRESDAIALCRDSLRAAGMDRVWHPILIRFGENTLKTFKERSVVDPVLKEDDIFFLDLGVVWDGHEGDAGGTFVVGNDERKRRCADGAKRIFKEVEEHWRRTGASGLALYDVAKERCAALGWELNVDVKGHRVCDFPHAIYRAGSLGDFASCPDAGLWILEIQIANPSREFGAFYEDILA